MSGLLLATLLSCAAPVEDAPEPVPSALDARAYRWCHEAGVDGHLAQDFCELVDVSNPGTPCAGLEQTCRGDVEFSKSGGCDGGGGSGAPNSPAGSPETSPDPWEPATCEAPPDMNAVGTLLQWAVAIVLAMLLLGLLRLIAMRWSRDRVPEVSEVGMPPIDEEDDPELDDVPSLPTDALLRASVVALERGDLGESVLLARAAVLRGLGRGGRLVLHRSKTDREYERSLREDDAHADVSQVLSATEVHRFGGHPIDPQTARAAVDAARRVLGMGLVLLTLLPGGAQGQTRYGPYGDVAILEMLKDWGHDARWRETALEALDDSTDMLVLAPDWVEVTDEDWAHLDQWMTEGGVLVVGGGHQLPEAGEVVEIPAAPMVSARWLDLRAIPPPRLPGGADHGIADWPGMVLVSTWQAQGPDVTQASWPVVGAMSWGAGTLVVIADERLLLNGALVWLDNQQFLGELPHLGQALLGWDMGPEPTIELYTTMAVAQPSPPAAVMRANLLPLVIHLMLAWLVVGLWRGMAFAPLRDPVVLGRRDFADHVRALGLRWHRGGYSRSALAALGALWLQRLGVRGLTRAGLAAGRSTERMAELLEAIEQASNEPDGPSTPADLEWMEELWTITKRP